MSLFGNLFKWQNRRVFPKLDPANGPSYCWDTFGGELAGSYGPFGEVYATYIDQPSDNLEDVDWATGTFPPAWDYANKNFPVILGTNISKAKSFDNACKSRFNKIPLHITADGEEAYAVGLIPGATYALNPGLDVIHMAVHPSTSPYELSFLDRYQIPMCLDDGSRHEWHWAITSVAGYDQPAPPDFATIDDAGNTYTVRWMKAIPSGVQQWQRVEIRKFDGAGDEVWRNCDCNNDFAPLGCGLLPVTPAPSSPATWVDSGTQYRAFAGVPDLSSIVWQLSIQIASPWYVNGLFNPLTDDATLLEGVTFEWEFSRDSGFATVVDSGTVEGVLSGDVNGYVAVIGGPASDFGAWEWPEYWANNPPILVYLRMRTKVGDAVSAWASYSGWYAYQGSIDDGDLVIGIPYYDLGYSEPLPSGYRWVNYSTTGQAVLVGGELVLLTVLRSYHYTEGEIDLNGSTPITYYAVAALHFSASDGTFISLELLTNPTTTNNGNLPTVCQTEVVDGKLYVYWGLVYHDAAFYYEVSIRAVAGTWTHIEWTAPMTSPAAGKLIIDNGQAMIVTIFRDIFVMTFSEVGYANLETIAGDFVDGMPTFRAFEMRSGYNNNTESADNNFALSIDHKKFYVARYQAMIVQGFLALLKSYACLPGISKVTSNAVWFQLI